MCGLGIRWTVGDVSERGLEALGLSIWGAYKLFGPDTRYAVCVNHLSVRDARMRVGVVPDCVEWVDASSLFPEALRPYLDESVAEGAAWKLAPFSVWRDHKELALDNDCILWRIPPALEAWLRDSESSVLLAEDVKACFGAFAHLCGSAPRSSGMRGLPPDFDLEHALLSLLRLHPARLRRELDEQGLQVAALSRGRNVHTVSVDDVTIASPFPPHLPRLGRCGAHFVGLNSKSYPWSLDGRPAEAHLGAFWDAHLPELRRNIFGMGATRAMSTS